MAEMCSMHPKISAVFSCNRCHKPLCQECRRQRFGTSYCQGCFEAVVVQAPRPSGPLVTPQASRSKDAGPSWLNASLFKKVVMAGIVIALVQNFQSIKAMVVKSAAPLTEKMSSVPGVGTMVNPAEAQQRGLVGTVKAQLASFASGLATHKSMNGQYPDDFNEFVRQNFQTDAEHKDMTRDAWNNPYQYTKRGNGYEIRSAGPDLLWGTADDVVKEKSDSQ